MRRGFVIVSRRWTQILTMGRAKAITLFPFILIGDRQWANDRSLLNHERIHIRQALELGILPFYIIYTLEFLWKWVRIRNFQDAYRSISFEKEAYQHESDHQYLKRRKWYAQWRS